MKIETIDKNFDVNSGIKPSDIIWYDANQSPFEVYGVSYIDGKYRRMPENTAQMVSPHIHRIHTHTAGGRVRFRTDSPYIAIHTKMDDITKMSHFALTGSAGFDLYAGEQNERFINSFVPPYDIVDGYDRVIEFEWPTMRNVTIHFPLYSGVNELYIGLQTGSKILQPLPYRWEKPVVYYGSSITQGGCASRPGNAYPAVISRMLNCDHINLGFSGSALAEDAIAEHIRDLDMLAFVYDYDCNAPSVEHLENTHKRMFQCIRKENPDLPIIMMAKPEYTPNGFRYAQLRFEVIKRTFDSAVAEGDQNVYLLSGKELMKYAQDEGTIDYAHPNDYGFYSMAKTVGETLKVALEK